MHTHNCLSPNKRRLSYLSFLECPNEMSKHFLVNDFIWIVKCISNLPVRSFSDHNLPSCKVNMLKHFIVLLLLSQISLPLEMQEICFWSIRASKAHSWTLDLMEYIIIVINTVTIYQGRWLKPLIKTIKVPNVLFIHNSFFARINWNIHHVWPHVELCHSPRVRLPWNNWGQFMERELIIGLHKMLSKNLLRRWDMVWRSIKLQFESLPFFLYFVISVKTSDVIWKLFRWTWFRLSFFFSFWLKYSKTQAHERQLQLVKYSAN